MSVRFWIAVLVFMMVNAVVFGIGVVTVVSIPELYEKARTLMPIVIVASFIISAPVSWLIAPRLRARFWRRRAARRSGGVGA